jgi:acetoin utilization deacetylase AcuC-like enzyme
VHQGNGTASILQNDSTIFTLSIHGENNFPFKKEVSDLDLGLPDGCNDSNYLKALAECLDQLDSRFKPDCIIYLAGADPHEDDRLGRLNISSAGMKLRDEMVLQFAFDRKLPVAISMAGGYGKEIESTVNIHFQTIKTALQFQKRY